VEVLLRTEGCIKESFQINVKCSPEKLGRKFILLKASSTIALQLDKICSKSTKQADKALACLQILTLDVVGPISKALEMINTKADEVKVDLDKLGTALEAAMTFLGIAFTQTTNLRRQRIMEDINKDLVSYTMEQETHFMVQVTMPFEPGFMKNATEHWDQVKALGRM